MVLTVPCCQTNGIRQIRENMELQRSIINNNNNNNTNTS